MAQMKKFRMCSYLKFRSVCLSFCASPLVPLALALAGATCTCLYTLCAVVLASYWNLYLLFTSHSGSKKPVDYLANKRNIISKIREYFLCVHTFLVLPCCSGLCWYSLLTSLLKAVHYSQIIQGMYWQ